MSLAGAVAWAVVPFAPQAPFRIYAGTEQGPFDVPDAGRLIAAAKKGGDQQFTYLVPGKVRPVLVLSDAHDEDLGEYLALRLSRFGKLTAEEQQAVREHQHPTLFHLEPEKFGALPEENAAMIAALVRVHRTAVDQRVCGRLDDDELTTVHEQFIRFHGFDLRRLVEDRLKQLAALPAIPQALSTRPVTPS
ncbi:MAG TPA: hypothetical protein VK631_25290 [Solirubrobacteraceae bacterium]|nr:hypothetical protein [Solirubrobacteraceae bacterium]